MVKVIHCIWLGGTKTKLAEKCRASWERFAPDWEIREWNEVPADAPPYVRRALREGKWAFASDWMRFWILERDGGLYFDFDVELVKPLTASLVELGIEACEWCATEWLKDGSRGFAPGAGLALDRQSANARRMLSVYAGEEFDGQTTVGDLMALNGVRPRGLAPEIFCPFDYWHRLRRTERTIGMHHYALSWITPRRRVARWLNWHGLGGLTEWLLRIRKVLRG